MCQFIESICCEKKQLRNLEYHQKRFERTRIDHFTDCKPILLSDVIDLPKSLSNQKYKIRIVYDKDIQTIEYLPYEINFIKTIRLFSINNDVEYFYKYKNRTFFNKYLNETRMDDLILVKSNYITDCIFSNIVFFDGNQWFTPKTFLLKGTMREALLNSGEIIEKNIQISDLQNFQSFKRINAMMNLDESQEIDISYLF